MEFDLEVVTLQEEKEEKEEMEIWEREFEREKWEMLWLIPLMMKCYGLQIFIQELLASLIG